MALGCCECILYSLAGILYLLFCIFFLKRTPQIVSASGPSKPGYAPGANTPGRRTHSDSNRASFHGDRRERRIWRNTGGSGVGAWDWGQAWTTIESEQFPQVILICSTP